MTGLHFFSFLFFIVLNSCGDSVTDQESTTKILYIDSTLVDCEGLAPQKCMLIRENPEDEWTYFYDEITGFEYQEGYVYQVVVEVSKINNPPADGSSLAYTLVKIISKEKKGPTSSEKEIITQLIPDKVVYEASSRGFFERIEITSDSIKKTTDRNQTSYRSKDCKKEDWKTITTSVQPVNLEEMETLKAPSGKRLYDGAAHATVTIILGDIQYKSSTFDHKNPPATLKPLVNQILSLAESIE